MVPFNSGMCYPVGGWYLAGNDWEGPGVLSFLHLSESGSCSAVSDSLQPHGLHSPWNSLGQNTGVGFLFLLQGIFPTQGSNPVLPHCRWVLYRLSYQRSPSSFVCLSPKLTSHLFISHHTNFSRGSAHGFSYRYSALPDRPPSWIAYCQVVRASLSFFSFLVKIICI